MTLWFFYNQVEEIRDHLPSTKLLIIDEAHNINSNNRLNLYDALKQNIQRVDKLLLLAHLFIIMKEIISICCIF